MMMIMMVRTTTIALYFLKKKTITLYDFGKKNILHFFIFLRYFLPLKNSKDKQLSK
jgi:hypothetical protein